MGKISNTLSEQNETTNYHFGVYKHHLVITGNRMVSRQFIAIKYDNGYVRFTDFHRYVRSPVNRVKHFTSDGNNRFAFVVQLLNYAFLYRNIGSLDRLDAKIVAEFLNLYGMGELPWDDETTTRSESTVTRCVRYILDFCELLSDDLKKKCRLKKDELYTWKDVRDKRGKLHKVKVPVFDVKYSGNGRQIFRDIPDKAFSLIFRYIVEHHTDMLGLLLLSAFCGLRPGEACNVRREDSPLGAGIMPAYVGNELVKVEVDVREELDLRGDNVAVGRIKKERKREMPDIFLSIFNEYYTAYMRYMDNIAYDKERGPFSVNSRGKAMTYATYYKRFQNIVKNELIPLFLASDDPELVMYGRILTEHNISPHIFRHWFTVQLVLSGIDNIGTLMYYRGDKSPQSSLTYLQSKGDLEKQYKRVNDEMFEYRLWESERKFGRKDGLND